MIDRTNYKNRINVVCFRDINNFIIVANNVVILKQIIKKIKHVVRIFILIKNCRCKHKFNEISKKVILRKIMIFKI